MDILGDWWAPLIVRECLYGTSRFDEFQRWLGIGRNMLTRRLSKLVDQGILIRTPYSDHPQRFEYRLTEKGFDAAGVLLAFMPFGERWLFGEQPSPITVYSRKTERPVAPMLVDRNTGEEIDPRELYAGPGQSFPVDDGVRRDRFREFYRRRAGGF